MPCCIGKKKAFSCTAAVWLWTFVRYDLFVALSCGMAKLIFHQFCIVPDVFCCAWLIVVVCLLRRAAWARSALQRPWPRILARKQQLVMVCCPVPKLINPIRRGLLIGLSRNKKLLWAYLWEMWRAMELMYHGFLLSHGWVFLLTMGVGRSWLAVKDMTMLGLLETGLNFGKLTRRSTRTLICLKWMGLIIPKLLPCSFMATKVALWKKMEC